jgi:hypothetical protein
MSGTRYSDLDNVPVSSLPSTHCAKQSDFTYDFDIWWDSIVDRE